MAQHGTGLRDAIAVAEYDQAHAAAMEALADAQAFLLVVGNERYELNSHIAVLNGTKPAFLVAATAVAACNTSNAVYEGTHNEEEEAEEELDDLEDD